MKTIYVVNLGYQYDSAELCDYDYLQNFTAVHGGIHSEAYEKMLEQFEDRFDDGGFWADYELDRQNACKLLAEIEGEEYKCSIVQGYMQSEWDYVFYPANREEFLDDFKDIYFGYVQNFAVFEEQPTIVDGAILWYYDDYEMETYLDHFGTIDDMVEDIAQMYGAEDVVYYESREVRKTIYEEKDRYYVPRRTN